MYEFSFQDHKKTKGDGRRQERQKKKNNINLHTNKNKTIRGKHDEHYVANKITQKPMRSPRIVSRKEKYRKTQEEEKRQIKGGRKMT